MMPTILPEPLLTAIHAEAAAMAALSPYVDPDVMAEAVRVIAFRGEPWVASVLGRDLTRRSVLFPHLPWLDDGEAETLCLADRAERRYLHVQWKGTA